jgi:hypothetical protein
VKTFRIEPVDPREHTYIKGEVFTLKYLGGETHVPAAVAALLMRGKRNDDVFVVDIDNPTSHLSLIRWIGGATNISRETAQEIASLPRDI